MKKKMSRIINIFFIIVFSSLLVFSVFNIINWKLNNHQNKKINNITHEYITVDEKNDNYDIDFDRLKNINPDIVAYLKVPGTNIDYVVVKTTDNDYYLTHNIEKKNNKSGWIFMDYSNKLDQTDKNIVIYGHNTADKSMFGSLKNILYNDWYDNESNYTIILATENGIDKYRVFSTYKIDNEEYYIKTDFSSDKEFGEFIKTIKSRSNHNYNVDVDENDQILTLSTCSNQGKKRVVLHAKKIINME